DPCLEYLVHLLTIEVPKLWGPFASSCIIKSTLDMLTGCMLENRFQSGYERLAQKFPRFVRRKSGNSEAYIFFNFPEAMFPEAINLGLYVHSIPGPVDVTDFVNDIFSYYKERVLGNENNTYIVSEARRQKCPSIEVLEQTCQRTCAMHKHLKQKLAIADERVLRKYCSYVDGMVTYHITNPRYRLEEI
ncbi:terpenoid synthase, partial [Aspergillus steynii IBT 23096]